MRVCVDEYYVCALTACRFWQPDSTLFQPQLFLLCRVCKLVGSQCFSTITPFQWQDTIFGDSSLQRKGGYNFSDPVQVDRDRAAAPRCRREQMAEVRIRFARSCDCFNCNGLLHFYSTSREPVRKCCMCTGDHDESSLNPNYISIVLCAVLNVSKRFI